jgi:diaminopimelate decarboxylase
MDIKCNCGTHYAVLDGGIHQINYDGQIMGMKIPELRLLPSSKGEEQSDLQIEPHLDWTLCGSLCTHNDILIRKVSLPELQIGDVLAFCRAGAYSVTEGMALFLSRELPRVFLYAKKHGFKQIRKLTPTDPMNTPDIQ